MTMLPALRPCPFRLRDTGLAGHRNADGFVRQVNLLQVTQGKAP